MLQYLAHQNGIEATGALLGKSIGQHSCKRFKAIHPFEYLAADLCWLDGSYLKTMLKCGTGKKTIPCSYIQKP